MAHKSLEEILARVEIGEDGCWVSSWALTDDGYSIIWSDGGKLRTHRLVYELTVGPIPDGYQVDHLCRNRACCNPAHLEAVTPSVNVKRSYQFGPHKPRRTKARTTHCPQGHEYTAADVRPCGVKQCRRCENERRRKKAA